MEDFNKNQPKSLEYHMIFFKTTKLMCTDINIYPKNNGTDHIISFIEKEVKQKLIFSRFYVGFGAES